MRIEANFYGDDGAYLSRWDFDTIAPMSKASKVGVLNMLDVLKASVIAAPPMPNDQSHTEGD